MMKILLIDGNSIGYACHHGTKLKAGDLETQAVFGFIRSMRDLKINYPHHEMLILWDGKTKWRYDLLPTYKGNRTSDDKKVAERESYKKQVPLIQTALNCLGVKQYLCKTHEADDIAGHIVKKMVTSSPDNEIVLITGDRDWLQLVQTGVSWIDLRDRTRYVNIDNFEEKTGYSNVKAFLESKCLQGDASDSIPGVGGIGEKGAKDLLTSYGSVEGYRDCLQSGSLSINKKAWAKLATEEGFSIFSRNYQIMQLQNVTPPQKENVVNLNEGGSSKVKFSDLCDELAFMSISNNIDSFTKPFGFK